MLDGIDYYPKRKKRTKLKFFLLLLFFAAVYGAWFYLDNMKITESTQSTSIVISQPEANPEESSVKIVVERTQQLSAEVETNNSENLDKVIQTYEASSHD